MNEIERYILKFSAYGEEPFHLIASSAIDDHVCNNVHDLSKPIVDLFKKGLITVYYHSGISGEPYKILNIFEEETIIKHIDRNINGGFNGYPERNGEYFFRTTDKGYAFVSNID